MANEERIRITEIFRSLQGEADTIGTPTTFVRLTGCPLRCQYCDTVYAFTGGEWWTLDAILDRVRELEASHEQLPARELADWILEDRLPVRFQIQLHKYLWGNVPGR